MIPRNTHLRVLLAALFLLATPLWSQSPQSSGKSLPFDLYSNQIYVQARVNGSRPLWFVLDSGASGCTIDLAHARAMGLKMPDTHQGTGAGAGTVSVAHVEGATVRLVGLDAEAPIAYAIDLSSNLSQMGRPLDGILGYDFFDRYVVEVNYDAKVLRVFDPKNYQYRGRGVALPFVLERKLPRVMVSVKVAGHEPEQQKVLIDSGSADGADVDQIAQSSGPKLQVVGGVGLGQEHPVIAGRVERLGLGDVPLSDVAGVSGGVQLIGGEVLRRFTVIFDYSRARIILEPNRHIGEPFLNDGSGADLRFAAAAHTFEVHSVLKGSAAEESGLREGDQIIAIDGTPSSAFSMEQVGRLFERGGATYSLSVRRGKETRAVSLTTRSMF